MLSEYAFESLREKRDYGFLDEWAALCGIGYFLFSFSFGLPGIKSIEIEFTQCLVFVSVKRSPSKT